MEVSKKITGLALAGVAALGLASAANATTYIDTFSSAASGGVLSAGTIDVGQFTHQYTLVLDTSGKLTGGLISTANAYHGSGDFDFGTATLTGPNGFSSQLNISQFMDLGAGPLGDQAYFWAPVLAAGTYTLTVTGTSYSADSGFGGYITFAAAPVPEVATWAMMLGGFGLMGASMRRRQSKVTFA